MEGNGLGKEKQIKKWRKVNDKDNLSRFKRATL